jgi:hypothetical protein
VPINRIIRIRTRYFRHAYPPTRDIWLSEVELSPENDLSFFSVGDFIEQNLFVSN